MADFGDGGRRSLDLLCMVHFPPRRPSSPTSIGRCDTGAVLGGFSSEVENIPGLRTSSCPPLNVLAAHVAGQVLTAYPREIHFQDDAIHVFGSGLRHPCHLACVTTASKPLLVPPSRRHGNGPPLVPYFLFLGVMFCHLPPLHAFWSSLILSPSIPTHSLAYLVGFPTQPHQLLPLQISLALLNILHPLHCPVTPSGSLGAWLDMEAPPFSRYPRRQG